VRAVSAAPESFVEFFGGKTPVTRCDPELLHDLIAVLM
jgi:hypothetical protein